MYVCLCVPAHPSYRMYVFVCVPAHPSYRMCVCVCVCFCVFLRIQRGMGTGTYRKHADTSAVKIAQVRIFSSAHHMLHFFVADLLPNCGDPVKFYIDLYGGCTCARAFVAMRFEGPDEASCSH